jgi:RecB family exonuclease
VRRLLAWHRSRRDRTVVATEEDFDTVVLLDGQEAVRLRGRVDRLETDADGRAHVVDFKTTKNPPAGSVLPDNPQLGLYQLATDRGAFADRIGEGASSGGAELIQLRVPSGSAKAGGTDGVGELPKVQEQPPQQPDESGRLPIELQLSAAVSTVREERFDAVLGGHCTFCDFASLCPAQVRSDVLS